MVFSTSKIKRISPDAQKVEKDKKDLEKLWAA
jgi:hypothetical protein